MRILFIGDVVGRTGREAVATSLPKLREALRIDLAVVNAENASHGFGLSPDMADALFAAGADVITLGNHAWDRKEIIPYIAETPRLLRPLNFPPGTPGGGSVVVEVAGRTPRAGACRRWGGCTWTRSTVRSAPLHELLARHRLGGTVAAIFAGFPRRGVEREDGVRAFPRRPGVGGGRHAHALSLGAMRRCCRAGRRSSRMPACRATTTA